MQGTGKSQHECIFNYHTGQLLAVVRCGDYKLHFDGEAPRLYDLIQDMHEDQPLDYKSDASLQAVFDKITAARTAHLATVVPVVDQILLGYDDDYALCGAPDSQVRAAASACSCWVSQLMGVRTAVQERYPNLPNCTLSPQNWVAPWPAPPKPRSPILLSDVFLKNSISE